MKIDTIEQIDNNKQPRYSPYRSLEKALDVLRFFSSYSISTVTEISRKLGYPKSTISGLLKTLSRYELVEKNKDNSFRLGIKAFELGFSYLNGMEMHKVARLWAERLLNDEQEPVHVAIRRGTGIYIILDVQPPASYMAILQTGMNVPAHSTALGKILIAAMPDDELDVLLKKPLGSFTEYTITDPARLRDELIRVKQSGYAIDREESLKGLICISAPVFQRDGSVIAAVSISSMELVGNEDKVLALIPKIKTIANNISRDIGYQPAKSF